MRRLALAFVCFFLFLFRKRLPEAALALAGGRRADELPPPAKGAAAAEEGSPRPDAEPRDQDGDREDAEEEVAPPAGPTPEELAGTGAVQLLAALQRHGRLVDFLMEPLGDYADNEIGAAVRPIHSGCRRALDEALPLEPVLEGAEEEPVTVPEGFDPAAVRLLGKVAGEPPFQGTLKHPGWRVREVCLPSPEAGGLRVVAPAEVEIG